MDYGTKDAIYGQVRGNEMFSSRTSHERSFAFISLIILEESEDVSESFPENLYSLLTFETLQNLHLGVLKLLKLSPMVYWRQSLMHWKGREYYCGRTLQGLKANELCASSSLFASSEKLFLFTGLHVHFWKAKL